MTTKISQKDYLKKYLSGDVGEAKKNKKKKKKEKDSSTIVPSVQIIDDDIDLSKLAHATDDDLDKYYMGEDAPQIVGIVDERPPELVAQEDYSKNRKWKTLGTNGEPSTSSNTNKIEIDKNENNKLTDRKIKQCKDKCPDASPPRQRQRNISPGTSVRRQGNRSGSRDASPPRRRKQSRSKDTTNRRDRSRSADASPLRRNRSGSTDASPPRRRRQSRSKDTTNRRDRSRSADASPFRRNGSRDASPPRRRRQSRSKDRTNPRDRSRSADASPVRRVNRSKSNDMSSSHRSKRNNSTIQESNKQQLSDSPPPTHKKMVKTLDGKIAGLQNATALREENEKFRKREDEMYKRMTANQSNDGEQVARNRKTGRRRHIEEQSEKEKEKMQANEEKKAVYTRWGKGLKQIEEYKERVADELHEQSKPLARYTDDKDLDIYLKQQCRDGDPMAEYFRKKSNETKSGPSMPIYQGSFPENRFNIRPGYRWDGVDRSNGYETKWFQVQSKNKATEEEAYKYSVEDM